MNIHVDARGKTRAYKKSNNAYLYEANFIVFFINKLPKITTIKHHYISYAFNFDNLEVK